MVELLNNGRLVEDTIDTTVSPSTLAARECLELSTRGITLCQRIKINYMILVQVTSAHSRLTSIISEYRKDDTVEIW